VKEAKELAMAVGKGWFVAAIGGLLGIYGAVELIVHSNATGWAWIAGGLGVMLLVSLNVAHRAFRVRNAALRNESSQASVIFQGGEHNHYYGEAPPKPGGPD